MMERLSGINGRLVSGVLLVQLVMVPLLFGGVLYMVERNYIMQFIEHVRADALMLSNNELAATDPVALQNHLDNAVLTGRIAFGSAVSSSGEIIANSVFGLPHDDFAEDFSFRQHDDSTYNIVVPIEDDVGRVAALRIGYDESLTREQIDLIYRRGLWLAIAYLLVTTSVMLLLGRKITHPIRYLEDMSRKVAHGFYEGGLTVETGIREISSLSESLEYMRHALVAQSNAMKQQALHDMLTGLPNRSLLFDRMDQAILTGRRDKRKLAVLLIDLNKFKEINDTLGHHAGDIILKQVAERLLSCVDSGDTVARLGGDEFCVVLLSASQQRGQAVAHAILDSIRQVFLVDDHRLYIGASIGISCFPEHGETFEELLNRSDIAMYIAKEEHTGLRWYTPELERKKTRQLVIASELKTAIDNNDLRLYFQPKLELASGRVDSAECLLRWIHPQRGVIPPDEFIGIAERTGLIHPLTTWVLHAAVAQCGEWRKTGIDLKLAVNFSAHNLTDERVPDLIAALLSEHKVPPDNLEIELTESAIFSDAARALDILQRISNMGITLSIDDFGTGFSSLYQLRRLPVDQIKIDRSFVSDMRNNDNDAAIVRATIRLAHELELAVVAEGVEDQETLEILQSKGCELAQGYLISRPLPGPEFIDWLRKSKKFKRGSDKADSYLKPVKLVT